MVRPGHWGVRARVERFSEPALLLLLRERAAHGYELLEALPELTGEARVDMGNLYRVLRALARSHRHIPRSLRREVTMHHGRRRFHRGLGRRWYERENVLERLENYQRDLEQELADVSELITRLRAGEQPGGTPEPQSV